MGRLGYLQLLHRQVQESDTVASETQETEDASPIQVGVATDGRSSVMGTVRSEF